MTTPASTSRSTVDLQAADFGTRFSAFMIDAALLFAVQWIAFIVLSRQLQAVGMTSTEPCAPGSVQFCEGPSTALWALLLLVLVASTVGYHAVFEGHYGATPGKRWMGLRVVDTHGHAPIGILPGVVRSLFRQAFWISLFFTLDASPLGLPLPAAVFIVLPLTFFGFVGVAAVDPNGLGVHDRMAGTKVVRAEQLIHLPGDSVAPTAHEQNSEESV